MKRNLLSLTVAALLCCTPFAASARDAGKSVAAQFESIVPSKLEFKPVPRPETVSFGVDASATPNECQWQVLNIPVRIGAAKVSSITGEEVIPNYVSAITFHVYLLIDVENAVGKDGRPLDKKKRPTVLDKEITYVDIPLKKSQGTRIGNTVADAATTINVGVFLSPSDVHRIVEKDTAEFDDPKGTKTQPRIKVLAVAMEAKYNDVSCWHRDKSAKDDDIKVSSDIKTWLPERWWKKNSFNNRGAKLRSINETPYAAHYYPSYCATRPLFGAAGGGSADSMSYTPTPPAPGTDTPAADTGAGETTDTTATDTTDTGSSSSSSSSSNRKKRRSSRN